MKNKWLQEKKEKGKEWVKKNKLAIGFGIGMAAMTGLYMLLEKLDEAQGGAITFTKHLEKPTPDIIASVYYINRFGREKNPLNIQYDYTSAELKELCNNLNRVVYPED